MAFTLLVFRAQVEGLVSANDTELSEIRRDRLIKAALERYSKDNPDTDTIDITGDAGRYYGIVAELATWVEGFSRVLSIEYPAATVASDELPRYLEAEDWDDDYWDGSTRYLFLPNHAPAATEAMRVVFTVPWLWTVSAVTEVVALPAHGFVGGENVFVGEDRWEEAPDVTVATHQVSAIADADNFTAKVLEADPPAGDFFAICHLAAGLICQAIAARYSRTTDSSISADSVDHLTRAQEFSRRAKEFIMLYEEHVLPSGDEGRPTKASGEFVDWDTSPAGNRNYLFHRNR
jgi:hypothetical protein